MNIAVVFGLGAPASGNGLAAFAVWCQGLGHTVDMYAALDIVPTTKKYDLLVGHSYGAADCIDYAANVPHKVQLLLIEPVLHNWFLNPFYWLGMWKFKLSLNVTSCKTFYTHSFPISARVTGAFETPMYDYGHTSILKPALAQIQAAGL